MTIRNEAARLFFAISALILVTMLTAPPTDNLKAVPVKRAVASEAKSGDLKSDKTSKQNRTKKVKKTADKKDTRKIVLKKT